MNGSAPEPLQHADRQFRLGRGLAARGDNRGAIDALCRCLTLDPRHADAHHALGTLFAKVGFTRVAIPFLEMAVSLRPDCLESLVELGNVLQADGETARAHRCFRRVCEARPLVKWAAAQEPPEFSALLVQAPGVANTPPEFLFANSKYQCHFFALLADIEPDLELLRRHGDIVINLISDADQGRHVLSAAADVIERLGKPIVNHPRCILATGRDAIAKVLAGIHLCRVPRTIRTPREKLLAADAVVSLERAGLALPMLLRVAGSHGGDTLERIESNDDIAKFLGKHDAPDLYVTEYADYRSTDGYFRKYRFVFTDQEILPYHLAIGNDWKVHHYTTEMDRHAWMQDEEQGFLTTPDTVFSPAHHQALAAIRAAVGLEFFGIDCSLDRDGNILVFEVNASILIHDDNANFPYKTPHCLRIKSALDRMLTRIATGTPA
jgi:tetratricopeptide (TPR) repeat protein